MENLHSKRIIVTGGTLGIGAAIVRAYAQQGAHVASLARSEQLGLTQAAELTAAGPGRVAFFRCDVANRAEVKAAFAAAVETMGGLDALVHNAGIEEACPAESITDELWERLFNVNAHGTLITNQEAFPYLRERGGRIVNFGSAAGVTGLPGSAAYSASKGAVMAWTRTVAREWAPYGITVNAIAPAIWTPMYDAFRGQMSAEQLDRHDAMMAGVIPLGGKLGDADADLAPMLAFLVSDGSRFITGQTISIDGGLLMAR